METRKIGSLEVTVVGLGTNNFGMLMEADQVQPVVDATLEAGINFIDTSDSYGESEVRLGKALGSHRDEILIATKFGSPLMTDPNTGGAAPAYLRGAVERSLANLGTDRIDLYQLHRPDPNTPIADTLAVLNDLIVAGKVREIGCSNFSAEQLRDADDAVAAGAARFVSVQNHYNLLHRGDEKEVIPECERLGIGYMPFLPLASGLLTGKYDRNSPAPEGTRLERWGSRLGGMLSAENFDIVEALTAWAEARDHTLLELAFAWLLAKPAATSVIAGATKAPQVAANAAAGEWRLSPEEVADIDAIAPQP
jgi:aryl-alcohol dehydrogenase-like predicted oxidoreductase